MNNVTNQKKRVAVYVRVSTQEQAEKFGKKAQLSQMKKWLANNKDEFTWNERHLYSDEGCSGASDVEEREALPKLFKAAKKGEFDVVLVWKLDRFFRKILLLLSAIEELKDMNVGFISTTQTEVNTTTPMGRMMLGLLGIIAEMERDLIIERTGAGRMEAAEAGKYVGGMVRYGYKITKEQKIVIDPKTSKIVKKIFQWFVNDRMNSYQIQQQLNAMETPTQADIETVLAKKKGTLRSSKRKKNPENFWHDSTIRKILRAEAYTGTFYYGKRTKKYDPVLKKKIEVSNPREEWVKLKCPQIIGQKMWKAAQPILDQNAKSIRRGKDVYLLSGKVECALCQSKFQGYMQPKTKMVNGVRKTMNKTPQYRCQRTNKTKAGVPCRNRQLSGTVLESIVWQQVEELLSKPEMFIWKVEEEERGRVDVKQLEKERDEFQKTLEGVVSEYERVTVLFQKGLKFQAKGELERETGRLLGEIKRLESEIDVIASQLMDAEEKRDRLASAKNLANKYAKKLGSLTHDQKRIAVQDIVKRVVVNKEAVRVELIIPKRKKAPKGGDDRSMKGDTYGATGRD